VTNYITIQAAIDLLRLDGVPHAGLIVQSKDFHDATVDLDLGDAHPTPCISVQDFEALRTKLLAGRVVQALDPPMPFDRMRSGVPVQTRDQLPGRPQLGEVVSVLSEDETVIWTGTGWEDVRSIPRRSP